MEVITHRKYNENISQAERWILLIGGSALAVVGLRKKSIPGVALAALGGSLVQLGATGHCYLYEAFGVTTAPKGQGASISVPYELGVRVDHAITVNKPREEVYAFW